MKDLKIVYFEIFGLKALKHEKTESMNDDLCFQSRKNGLLRAYFLGTPQSSCFYTIPFSNFELQAIFARQLQMVES